MSLSVAQRAAVQQQQSARRAIASPPPPATVHMLATDISNFTSPLTPQALELWKQDGIGLVIVQAFPPNYAQHKQQLEQMTACFAADLRVEAYIYDYLTAPDWRDACLAGLRGLHVTRVWADEEDVTPEAKGLELYQRIAAVTATLEAIEAAGYTAGLYTGSWWWGPYMNDTTIFQEYPLWCALYDQVPDVSVFTPFGGWDHCEVKQYAGSSVLHGVSGVDLDVT